MPILSSVDGKNGMENGKDVAGLNTMADRRRARSTVCLPLHEAFKEAGKPVAIQNRDALDFIFSIPYDEAIFSAKACPLGRDWLPGNGRIAEIKNAPLTGHFLL